MQYIEKSNNDCSYLLSGKKVYMYIPQHLSLVSGVLKNFSSTTPTRMFLFTKAKESILLFQDRGTLSLR